MVKLSIIIPVYNGEEYIDRCLQSCLRQDIPADSYEIVVVDDGSTDSSNVILSRYAMEHANVVVLTQSNKKQGAARNYGLSKAQGEYIWFVDSDDWIEANCLGRLLALCDDNGIEVLAIDRINTDGKSFQEKLRNTPADKIFSGLDFFKVLNNNLAICLYLWRRELLLRHKLRFVEGVVHEDTEFIPCALFYAKSVLYSRQPVYYVYCRPGSTTRKASLQRCLDLITVADSISSKY